MSIKKYLPEFIYGSIDGTVTTFAIVAGVSGAALSPAIVLVLGVANILADGFSMASSNYLSERSKIHKKKFPALKTAFATFVSFVTIGSVPILPYLFFTNGTDMFYWSCIFTAITFLSIGYLQGLLVGENKFYTSAETLLIGGIAATISYYVGYLLSNLIK